MHSPLRLVAAALAISVAAACSKPAASKTPPDGPPKLRYALSGPLIPAKMTMVTAWDFPQNPLTDKSLDQSKLSKEIQLGYRLFTNTPAEASRFVPGGMSCNNCHLNGGQRERAMPLVAISGVFPEYNRRAGRLISLNDRIVDCFLRSENATGMLQSDANGTAIVAAADTLPTPTSREVLALAAYLNWISRGNEIGKSPKWRGQNTIPQPSLVPVDTLDAGKGEAIYAERCASCHGPDGQGVYVGDKKPGPLWGPNSWNDGAGAARVYTLAGIIRYTMPYLDPGNMTDQDALNLAAFITSKPRPAFPFKDKDYLVDPLPPDAVYYPKRIAVAQ
ncbi:MAG: c-type cytochrome [Acidobacteria bacterium]|nr:c-type cytochrome [Acidobacteriota bacterium]